MSVENEKIKEFEEDNYSTFSDEDLINKVAIKNELAFEELFSRYALKIKSMMFRLGVGESGAEEISQEVMILLWRKAGLYDADKASVSSWIYTIARNYRIDKLRKIPISELDINDPTYVGDPQPTGMQILLEKEQRKIIQLAVERLSIQNKQILVASFFQGLSHSEIAKKFNLPIGTIKSKLRLSYQSLRGKLGKGGIEDLSQ